MSEQKKQNSLARLAPSLEDNPQYYQPPSDAYDVVQQYQRGLRYEQQDNIKKAIRIYTVLGQEQQYPLAQYKLGYCYEQGIGSIKQDFEKAFKLYQSAAQNN